MNPRDKELLMLLLVAGSIVLVFECARFVHNLNEGLQLMAEEMVEKLERYANRDMPDA